MTLGHLVLLPYLCAWISELKKAASSEKVSRLEKLNVLESNLRQLGAIISMRINPKF
jgi:hypothetical protein